ncbi:MAG: PEP-CTERM sorting domain-containing protein [Pseudomonadota bacterium]
MPKHSCHSLPNNHPEATGQSGTPMRVYTELFEEFGVTAVFNGHSELYERSFVDLNNDGQGIQFFEIGAAGDGLRGPRTLEQRTELNLNPFSQFMPNEHTLENWIEFTDADGNVYITLEDGGKHYGHIEVNIMNVSDIYDDFIAMVEFLPVYSFPVLDENFNLIGDTERRVYDDVVRLLVRADGSYVLVSEPATSLLLGMFGAGLLAVRRRRKQV